MGRWLTTRRQYLSLGATGTACLAGCADRLNNEATDDNGSSDDEIDSDAAETVDTSKRELDGIPEDGAVIFAYDDGLIEDYTQALPAHQAFNAPATTGIVTEWIGCQEYNGTDWMDVEHLEELEDAGWEIASHTTEHTVVGTYELIRDAESADLQVYPEEINMATGPQKTWRSPTVRKLLHVLY
ncbi:polysaccharide deacetylase family protein [Halalkalicoccus tibetensis]|uniref:Polysaccharide deacetylase family protein n=1 Tax=Halalkalicoccus tibetensis TaxID=175632 RepID=A0ABD5V2T6_9EURY